MKTNKFLTLVLTIVAGLAIVSCVQDDDYTIPTSLGDEENARLNNLLANGTEISIAEAKTMYSEGDFLEPIDENIYIKGYVSSSDKTGNFFKEFFLQDSPSNPTIAIKVTINQVDMYNQFNFGREVYVSLNGLYIGEERVGNGITAIGGGTETDQYGTTVTRLGQIRAATHVFRSAVTEEMTPLNVSLSQINGTHVGLYVQVDDVEFANNLAGKRYFDPMEDFDTKRALQVCEGITYYTLNLETSSFSDFKNELLPTGNGTLKAVVNKTFDGASVVLALNTLEDVNMEGERCAMPTAVFSEDFESGVEYDDVNLPGWTNYNANGGTNLFKFRTFNNNMQVRASAFQTNENPYNLWLVTPSVDLSASSSVTLTFSTKDGYYNGDALTTYVSTDFAGDPATATWTELTDAVYSTGNTSGFAPNWVSSGEIDLSAYAGETIHIGFEYLGASNGVTSIYEIDNVTVLAD